MNGILQDVEFMGLAFHVNDQVLNPRPETELLVETGLSLLRENRPPEGFGEPPKRRSPTEEPGPRVLEIGTGSGCVSISLSVFEPSARVTATDLCPEALKVARENARRLGVGERIHFKEGDLFQALGSGEERFQLILSNPPYIAEEEWSALPPEVRREPRLALWGGPEGLETLDRLIGAAGRYLLPGGWLTLEVGFRQAGAVKKRLADSCFSEIIALPDFAGIERIIVGRYGRV